MQDHKKTAQGSSIARKAFTAAALTGAMLFMPTQEAEAQNIRLSFGNGGIQFYSGSPTSVEQYFENYRRMFHHYNGGYNGQYHGHHGHHNNNCDPYTLLRQQAYQRELYYQRLRYQAWLRQRAQAQIQAQANQAAVQRQIQQLQQAKIELLRAQRALEDQKRAQALKERIDQKDAARQNRVTVKIGYSGAATIFGALKYYNSFKGVLANIDNPDLQEIAIESYHAQTDPNLIAAQHSADSIRAYLGGQSQQALAAKIIASNRQAIRFLEALENSPHHADVIQILKQRDISVLPYMVNDTTTRIQEGGAFPVLHLDPAQAVTVAYLNHVSDIVRKYDEQRQAFEAGQPVKPSDATSSFDDAKNPFTAPDPFDSSQLSPEQDNMEYAQSATQPKPRLGLG